MSLQTNFLYLLRRMRHENRTPADAAPYFPHNRRRVSKTGPSLQTQRFPSVVFSTQHRQAPTPQAIIFSNEASQGMEAFRA